MNHCIISCRPCIATAVVIVNKSFMKNDQLRILFILAETMAEKIEGLRKIVWIKTMHSKTNYSHPGWGPDRNLLWSDRPRPEWPLTRLVWARWSLCAGGALEVTSDHKFLDRKDLWSDKFHTIVQTKVRSNCDHYKDACTLISPYSIESNDF